jgi:hypothetical protein
MAEYINGFDKFGNMPVYTDDRGSVAELGSEGSGSSNLSTATLTISNIYGGAPDMKFNAALANVRGFSSGVIPNAPLDETITVNVILFEGTASLIIENKPENLNITISGDIEDFGNNMYAITGDCTITLSEQPT